MSVVHFFMSTCSAGYLPSLIFHSRASWQRLLRSKFRLASMKPHQLYNVLGILPPWWWKRLWYNPGGGDPFIRNKSCSPDEIIHVDGYSGVTRSITIGLRWAWWNQYWLGNPTLTRPLLGGFIIRWVWWYDTYHCCNAPSSSLLATDRWNHQITGMVLSPKWRDNSRFFATLNFCSFHTSDPTLATCSLYLAWWVSKLLCRYRTLIAHKMAVLVEHTRIVAAQTSSNHIFILRIPSHGHASITNSDKWLGPYSHHSMSIHTVGQSFWFLPISIVRWIDWWHFFH